MRASKYLKLLVVLLVAGGLIFGVHNYINRPPIREYGRVTSNLQNYWLNKSDVYFFSGTFFAKYNLKTNQIDRLSDYLYISSGINSVSWNPDAVVFQTIPQSTDRDDITTAGSNLSVDPQHPHWWKYDFQTKQYMLLGMAGADECTSVTQLSKELLACVAPGDGGEAGKLITYDLGRHTSNVIKTTDDGIGAVSGDQNNLYYVITKLGGNQELYSATLATQKNHVVYSSQGAISYLVNGSDVYIDETVLEATPLIGETHSEALPAKAPHTLLLIQDGSVISTKSIGSLPLTLSEDITGQIVVASLDGSISYWTQDGLQVADKPIRNILEAGNYPFKYDSRLYVIDRSGNLLAWASATKPAGYRSPSELLVEDNPDSGNSYVDFESHGKHDAAIYLNDVSSSAQQSEVGHNLEQKGFRPSEFVFNWIIDGPDFHVPIQPRAIIIK